MNRLNHSEEIISILREEITNYDDRTRRAETGTVLEIGDGIATVYGLIGLFMVNYWSLTLGPKASC